MRVDRDSGECVFHVCSCQGQEALWFLFFGRVGAVFCAVFSPTMIIRKILLVFRALPRVRPCSLSRKTKELFIISYYISCHLLSSYWLVPSFYLVPSFSLHVLIVPLHLY